MSEADDVFKKEAIARKKLINKALQEAGWRPIVGFVENAKYTEGAVREYPTVEGPADYVLFHNGKAVAAVEAKKRKLGPQKCSRSSSALCLGVPRWEVRIWRISFAVHLFH